MYLPSSSAIVAYGCAIRKVAWKCVCVCVFWYVAVWWVKRASHVRVCVWVCVSAGNVSYSLSYQWRWWPAGRWLSVSPILDKQPLCQQHRLFYTENIPHRNRKRNDILPLLVSKLEGRRGKRELCGGIFYMKIKIIWRQLITSLNCTVP